MLIIQKEQFEKLEQAARQNLAEQLAQCLRTFLPRTCDSMGISALLEYVRQGQHRAQKHGLSSRSSVYLYLCLMLQLGSDFDRDPQLPWAASLLQKEQFTDADMTIQRLYDESLGFLDTVLGVDNESFHAARMALLSAAQAGNVRSAQDVPIEAWWIRLTEIYAAKAKYLGPVGMACLVRHCQNKAFQMELTSERCFLLHLGLSLLLGTSYHLDALYPWAGEILGTRHTEADLFDGLSKAVSRRGETWMA